MYILDKNIITAHAKHLFGLIATCAALTLGAHSAHAQQIDSAYTELDLDKCNQIDAESFGDDTGQSAYFACIGYNNMLVFVAEGDLRFFVSYGENALNERSGSQTLPEFNTINDTLEWRVQNVNGAWQPFATILRYYTDGGTDEAKDEGQTLVVTKLEPGNSCHIGYVDARALADANVQARNIADQYANSFNCVSDEPIRLPN